MRTLTLLSISLFLGCAPGGTRTGSAPEPQTQTAGGAEDCGGLYALDVQNDGSGDVVFAFSDAKQLRPAQQIGVLRGKDATTLFFQFQGMPLVWAQPRNGSRVYVNDRAGQQRYRIRMTLRCDRQ